MRVRLLILALLASTSAGALGARGAPIDGARIFSDPAGDAPSVKSAEGRIVAAPDITTVTVADTTATGRITITVAAAKLVNGSAVQAWLNTDENRATGRQPTGDEFVLGVGCCTASGSLLSYLHAWDAAAGRWTDRSSTAAFKTERTTDGFQWTIDRSDLADTAGFAFCFRQSRPHVPPRSPARSSRTSTGLRTGR